MGLFDWLKPDKAQQSEPVINTLPSACDIADALVKAEEMAMTGHVSTPVLARVLRITTLVRGIVPRLANLGVHSDNAYTVVATATQYLPESLAAYLALPRDWADSRAVADGKSSLLLLIDQLDLLALTTRRMADAANRQDANALVAQGLFLNTKFTNQNSPRIELETTEKSSGGLLDLDS